MAGSEKYAFTIKGNDLPLQDGRGKTGMALGYALSATGADHVETPHDPAFRDSGVSKLAPVGVNKSVDPLTTDLDKVRFFTEAQRVFGINNVLGLCNFCSVPVNALTFEYLVKSVKAITDWDSSLYELMKISERSLVMARVFNNREGLGPKDDKVIRRWYEPMPSGPLKGTRLDEKEFKAAIDLYYQINGWDKKGRPTRGKLYELGLEWLIEYDNESSN